MSTDLVLRDLQKLSSGNSTFIELFEIQISDTDYIYITNYIKGIGDYIDESPDSGPPVSNVIQFRDYDDPSIIREYFPIPCNLDGVEHKSDGQFPQPTFTIANILKTVDNNSLAGLLGSVTYDDILGYKVIRRRTLQKYLYGESGDSNPPVEFPRDMYYLDRVEHEDDRSVVFNTVLPIDFSGLTLPRRTIIGNACPWRYKGAAEDINPWDRVGGCSWRTDSKLTRNGIDHYVFVNQDDEYIISATWLGTTAWMGTALKDKYYRTLTSGLEKVQPDGSLSVTIKFPSSDVSTGTDVVAISGHKFISGDLVVYNNGGGGTIGGLINNDIYYLRRVTANTVSIHLARSQALEGTFPINITTQGSGTNHTFSPSTFSYWQSINGGSVEPSDSSPAWNRVRSFLIYPGSDCTVEVFTSDQFNTYFEYSGTVWKNIGYSQYFGLVQSPSPGNLWERGDRCGKTITSCAMRFKASVRQSISYDSGVGTLALGQVLTSTPVGDRGLVTSWTGTTSGVIQLSGVMGTFAPGTDISTNTWTGVCSTYVASIGGTQPSATLDDAYILPFGGFPTARVFDR